MRNPSINVTVDTLKDTMLSFGLSLPESRFREFVRELSKNPCNWRTIQMRDKQVQRLTNDTVSSKVAGILVFVANLYKIKLPTLKPSSPNWWVVEKLAQIAVDLFDLYELNKSMDVVIRNMVDAILVRGVKSKDLPTRALEYYERESIKAQFDEYEYKEVALQLQRIYLQAVKSIDNKTLFLAGQDIVPFFRMTEDIVHYQADPADWIQAQFDAFMVFNTLPKPNTLYGEKAFERLLTYKSKK